MAKAKQATTPDASSANKTNVNDISGKLREMLNQSAREERGDANVETDLPQRKVAGGRSTWKGIIELPNGSGGILAKIAVKTCTAVDDEKFERSMFHSETCKNKLKQGTMTCTGCGETVDKNAALKGVVSDGEVIFVSDEELAKLVPQNEKTMRITEYVDAADIDPVFIEGTEFLYPEEDKTKQAAMTFAVLGAMLRTTGRVAKGVRVKRGKQQEFIVRPYGQNGLTINLIRAEYEVRDASSLWTPITVPGEAVEMFATVSESDLKPFTPAKRDQYLANANKLVADKKAGVVTECPTPEPEQKGTDDLLMALKATLAAKAGK